MEERKGSQELLSKEARVIRFRNFFSIKKTGLAAMQADDGPNLSVGTLSTATLN